MADEDATRRSPTSYTGWVGLAFIVIIVIAVINGAQTEETGILGVDGPERGWQLPPFAAPLAGSDLEGDANIADDGCEVAERPCPADRRRTAACDVDLEDAVRICDLFDRPLVISFWFTRQADCVSGQDTLERVAAEWDEQVNFLSVNIRDDRERVREIVEERGWKIPVVHDRDGAVSNIYGVGGCPTLVYAFPDGVLMSAHIGTEELEAERLASKVRELVRSSKRRDRRQAESSA